MKILHFAATVGSITIAMAMATSANAQAAGNLLGAPLVAGGGVVTAVAAGHAQIAPAVNAVSPTVEPMTDSVTTAIGSVGNGLTSTGDGVMTNGARVLAVQGGKPLISVGASNPADQGRLAAVANGPH